MTRNEIDVPDSTLYLKNPRNRAVLENKRNKIKNRKFRKAHEETVDSVVARYKDLNQENASNFTHFHEFPLSTRTLKGLEDSGFVTPTDIQRQSIGLSITGHDVVGAAKTGSGKTLALLIPLLECLWKNNWTKSYGLGALIITPTRELAYQIFQVLNKIGRRHYFSAALLIGGTDVEFEKRRLSTMNIIVCTPGRLLQHMDETDSFNCENLQMLVIDEADRILDMGFKSQMNAIIENLPLDRQTLLFSATQTRNVNDLVRVCLRDPVYVSVHERAEKATPDQLIQSYFVCKDEEKLNMLWSFLVNHKRKKTLIFVTCCKQARFFTTALRHLKPGLSLMGIWGTMKQNKRLEVVEKFDQNTRGAAMIATDIASRGLDFDRVDYVFQLDCPADVDDYIHRVGRTARMDKKGEAILVLNSTQEKPFIDRLKDRKIPVSKTHVDPKKVLSIRNMLSSCMIKYSDMKEMAQRCFVAYMRALHLMKLKDVFDVKSIDFKELAFSYGLAVAPRVRFLNKYQKNQQQKANQDAFSKALNEFKPDPDSRIPESDLSDDEKIEKNESYSSDEDDDNKKIQKTAIKSQKIEIKEDSDDEFLKVARTDIFKVLSEPTDEELNKVGDRQSKKPITKLEAAKKILRKGVQLNKKIIFNDDEKDEQLQNGAMTTESGQSFNLEEAKRQIAEQNSKDKKEWRERLRKLKKQKSKKKKQNEDEVLDLGAEESDEDGSVDLSWLPDPDNPKNFDDDNSEVDESEPLSEDDLYEKEEKYEQKKVMKRKLASSSKKNIFNKKLRKS